LAHLPGIETCILIAACMYVHQFCFIICAQPENLYSHGFPCFHGTGKENEGKKEPADTTGATTPALHADEP